VQLVRELVSVITQHINPPTIGISPLDARLAHSPRRAGKRPGWLAGLCTPATLTWTGGKPWADFGGLIS